MRQMHVPTALALVHLQDHACIAGWLVEGWVQAVLEALEALDIHMADVSPQQQRVPRLSGRLSRIPLALIFVVENKAAGCFRLKTDIKTDTKRLNSHVTGLNR